MAKKTIADLEKEIELLTAENAKLKDQPETLKEVLESEKVKALEAEIATLKATPVVDNKALEAKDKEIADLTKKLNKLTKDLSTSTGIVDGSFTAEDGKTYSFDKGVVKFHFKGEMHESVEALKNKELMQELVEMKVGYLTEVKPSK
jgi:cell division septum initiation protein DivIVA